MGRVDGGPPCGLHEAPRIATTRGVLRAMASDAAGISVEKRSEEWRALQGTKARESQFPNPKDATPPPPDGGLRVKDSGSVCLSKHCLLASKMTEEQLLHI